jgi:hypothetical protein
MEIKEFDNQSNIEKQLVVQNDTGKENQPLKSPVKSPIKSETFYHKDHSEPVKKFNLDLVETDFDELQKLTKPVEEEEQIDSPPEDNE